MNPGAIVSRNGWLVVAGWVALAAALWVLVPPGNPAAHELAADLPLWTPSEQTVAAMRKYFPAEAGYSQAVVVFERREGRLTQPDLRAIERVAAAIVRPSGQSGDTANLAGVTVRSPASIPVPVSMNPLISKVSTSGQAAMLIVNIPASFVSVRSYLIVKHIDIVLAKAGLPVRLRVDVTGFSGFGHDYAVAVDRSSREASGVALGAIVIILLLVYRAPLAAMVSLSAIGLALVVVFKVLDLGLLGIHAGTAERIFVFVLGFGAGTDYSLLLISRYREVLRERFGAVEGAERAATATTRPIVTSAMTNAMGLLSLCVAQFAIFRSAGIAVAIAIAVTMITSLTLVPALLALLGRAVFWPRMVVVRTEGVERSGSRTWAGVARLVTTRPARVLAVGLVALGAAAFVGARVPVIYDTLTMLGSDYSAVRGLAMVERHWGVGYTAPVTILTVADRPMGAAEWAKVSHEMTTAVGQTAGVATVRSFTAPLGTEQSGSTFGSGIVSGFKRLLVEAAVEEEARKEYVSPGGRAMRMEAVLRYQPMSRGAMTAVGRVDRAAEVALRQSGMAGRVMVGGETAQTRDLRMVTTQDFRRIMPLTLGVVLVIVLVLLRQWLLCVFMVICTMLTYLATLGISYGVLGGVLGYEGLDWKVRVLLFVVIVAVGVDYSIFLVARLREEMARGDGQQAIRRAVVRTGPVISSAGIVMAASLGSLMAGELKLLHRAGFCVGAGDAARYVFRSAPPDPFFGVLVDATERLKR